MLQYISHMYSSSHYTKWQFHTTQYSFWAWVAEAWNKNAMLVVESYLFYSSLVNGFIIQAFLHLTLARSIATGRWISNACDLFGTNFKWVHIALYHFLWFTVPQISWKKYNSMCVLVTSESLIWTSLLFESLSIFLWWKLILCRRLIIICAWKSLGL